MTVSSELNRKEYLGDGSTTAFATSPVVFFDAADLLVYLVSSAGVATLKTITTHYTVSGGDGSTGTVTMLTAPATGETLVIVRDVAATQSSDFVNNDINDAEVLEDALDRLTMLTQQNAAAIERSVRLADSDVTGADTELPTPVASTLIGWDSAGTSLQNYASGDLASTILVSSFMETLLDDADDTAARATLNIGSRIIPGTCTGAADTYAVAGSPAVAAYATGMLIATQISATNTGASTLNVDGVGAQNIVKQDETGTFVNTEAGDLVTGGYRYLFLQHGGSWIVLNPSLRSVSKQTIVAFTRDTATASGSQAVTGVGFRPSVIIGFGGVHNSSEVSYGMYGSGNHGVVSDAYALTAGNSQVTNFLFYFIESGANTSTASVASLDADGFTLTWTKNGTPTGTATLFALCIR
jgi:hypothetical protein